MDSNQGSELTDCSISVTKFGADKDFVLTSDKWRINSEADFPEVRIVCKLSSLTAAQRKLLTNLRYKYLK